MCHTQRAATRRSGSARRSAPSWSGECINRLCCICGTILLLQQRRWWAAGSSSIAVSLAVSCDQQMQQEICHSSCGRFWVCCRLSDKQLRPAHGAFDGNEAADCQSHKREASRKVASSKSSVNACPAKRSNRKLGIGIPRAGLCRLTASLMMHGRNNGKKIKAVSVGWSRGLCCRRRHATAIGADRTGLCTAVADSSSCSIVTSKLQQHGCSPDSSSCHTFH